jgi:hypothetical protein
MKHLLIARDRTAVNRAAPIGFATIRPADGEKFVYAPSRWFICSTGGPDSAVSRGLQF